MAERDFQYPYPIEAALDPWQEKLGDDYFDVVARLADRDRALEDYLQDCLARYAARAVSGAATTLVNGAFTKILLANLDYDDSGNFRTATSDYLVPQDGLYEIDAGVQVGSSGASQSLILACFVDGSAVTAGRGGRALATASSQFFGLVYNDQLRLRKASVVDIRVFVNVANTVTEDMYNRFSIRRVGPYPD